MEVPAKVKSAFESSHHSLDANWQVGPKGTYEASFVKSGKSQVYVYDKGARLIKKKQVTDVILLPTSIGNTLAYDYPTGDIEQAYRVMTKEKKKYYEVHVGDKNGVERVQFNLAGSMIGVVSEPKTESGSPMLASTSVSSESSANEGMMRGEATLETESELELIDDDIADLFEEEEEDFDIELEDDDDWEDVLLEDEEDDFEDLDLENWDVVEDDLNLD